MFDLLDRAGFGRLGWRAALGRLIRTKHSSWGLFLGHAGLAIAIAGVSAISGWRVETTRVHAAGETETLAGYDYTLQEVKAGRGPNYQTSVATVIVSRDGEPLATLHPERRWYPVERQQTTEAGIATRWHGDFYVALGAPNGAGGHVLRYFYNPGVLWIWVGAAVMALGGLVSLTDRRLRVGAPQPRRGPGRASGRPAAAAVAGAFVALFLALAAAPALAVDPDEMLDAPALEQKAQAIARKLRCVVCDNQSILDSNATIAKDLRILVRERVAAGDDEEAVLERVVSYYGDYVLFEPPVRLETIVLWAAPALFFIGGVALLVRRRRAASAVAPLSEAERAEARRLLKGDAP